MATVDDWSEFEDDYDYDNNNNNKIERELSFI